MVSLDNVALKSRLPFCRPPPKGVIRVIKGKKGNKRVELEEQQIINMTDIAYAHIYISEV